jgi:YD repeat-containing protein
MKVIIGCLFGLVLGGSLQAQYLYKDLVVTRQNNARWKLYEENHVRAVTLKSLEASGQPTDGFVGMQELAANYSQLTTHTQTAGSTDSWIISQYANGLLTRNTDTSDTYQSVTEYTYDAAGHILSITNTATETDNHVRDEERHVWSYDAAHGGKPASMLKIKNGKDTTLVTFISDEKGNITEERGVRLGQALPTIFYYYDADSRMTDIVRYSAQAKRLLPLNIFEYEEGRLKSMLVVPEEGNSFYQKWYYTYDEDRGLKTKDQCYNKQKDLLGSVEYEYTFK